MSFWSSETIGERVPQERLIDPFNSDRIKHGAYELSVGNEYYTTSMLNGKETVPEGSQIRIPPGQLALLITKENVQVPRDAIGFISIKFGAKMRGLINVSGFHVDPGFPGRLKFSVYNAGSQDAIFDPGQALFLIWFSDLTNPETRPYDGVHKNQQSLTAPDVSLVQGEIASPGELKRKIEELTHKVDVLRTIALVVLAALLGPIMIFWISRSFNNNPQSTPQQPTVQQTSQTDGTQRQQEPGRK